MFWNLTTILIIVVGLIAMAFVLYILRLRVRNLARIEKGPWYHHRANEPTSRYLFRLGINLIALIILMLGAAFGIQVLFLESDGPNWLFLRGLVITLVFMVATNFYGIRRRKA